MRGLPAGFAVVTVGKFLSNVSFRLVFPFLPRIVAGLGVSLAAMGTALAARELVGLANPALGRAADRRGHGWAMVVGLLGLAVALLLQGVAAGLWLFTIGLVVLSLAKALFDVAAGAWVGEQVPFSSRGRAMGLLETSWAAAFIIGMPVAALLIRATTWRVPFLVTAGACVVMAAVTDTSAAGSSREQTGERVAWTRPLQAGVATFVIIGIGHSMMLVTFASWLEDDHGVSIAALGLTAFVIGIAELGGSGGAAVLADRWGLTRSLTGALVGAVGASALLVIGNATFGLALLSMVAYFLVVEFAVVILLSLFSEFDQAARGSAMGFAFAAFSIGHAIGAIAGTQIYEGWGMTENVLLMAAVFALAAILVWRWMDDPTHDPAAT
jgi:predicted MFS family arabinose efflux permease